MLSAGAVLACALSLVGRSQSHMPTIELLEVVPAHVSPRAEAFTQHDTQTIYLITSSDVFREALAAPGCRHTDALRKLASILVHEEWHIRNGMDERGAYYSQLTALQSLGLGPDSNVYHGVLKSMQHVLGEQERPRERTVLARKRRAARDRRSG